MLVQEKTHHIEVNVTGPGSDLVIDAVKSRYPGAVVGPSADEDTIEWGTSPLAAEIRTGKTPGKLLRAYRERAALTVVELARLVGTKYPNVVAMESDRRTIGLDMARKLAGVFGCEYTKFLDAPDDQTER
ncbi:MAG: XRE family transcriptional regulator [Spirochaetaceae bacterium]|nr:MAG: XRE family transcriptional regulator [Spirochaetaceae bacterium]